MKRRLLLGLFTVGLSLLTAASSEAWETSSNVSDAFLITELPYTISVPGNYILGVQPRSPRPWNCRPPVIIDAEDVRLDLNGNFIVDPGLPRPFCIGILVNNAANVTIQNGTIENFGIGVYFAAGTTDKNAKNVVDNVHFNNDGIGVLSVSGTSNWVRNCIIDGGDIGIFFNQDSGSRASNNILEDQQKTQFFGLGVALLTIASRGVLFDENVIAKGDNAFGQIQGSADRYRFENFVGFGGAVPLMGGLDEEANSF